MRVRAGIGARIAGAFVTALAALASGALPAGEDGPGSRVQGEPPAVFVALEPEVLVERSTYRLADIARLSGDARAAAALAAVEIGRAPRPGYWADVPRQRIAARLQRAVPDGRTAVGWAGAPVVRVGTIGRAYPGGEVAGRAQAALEQSLAGRYGDVEIELVEPPRDLVVPAGRVELKTRMSEREPPASRAAVWVDVLVDDRHYRSLPVWFRVSAWVDVVTAARALERHHVFTRADLDTARLDVTRLDEPPLLDAGDVVGLSATRALRAGSPLTVSLVEPVPAIREGELVDVFTRAGRVALQVKAIALADGEVDQRVPVRSTSSGERYTATVVGRGALRVD